MGFGKGTNYSTTTATQQLPAYLQSAYQEAAGSASGLAGSAPNWTPMQSSAFNNINSLWGAGNPAFGSASTALSNSMVPTSDKVSQYMSPYISGVVNPMIANMQEVNAQQQQGVIGNAIAKGAMGGNRVGVAQGELARQQKLADNQQLAELYNTGYSGALSAAQADKAAQLQAAQGYTGLGQTQVQTGLDTAGAQLQAGTQQQMFPYQQQQWLAGILSSLGSTAGGTSTQQTPQGNIFSQLLGAGLGVASLFNEGGRVHAASGGVMGMPANDNFGSFAFAPALTGTHGSSNFPTIQAPAEEQDPLSQYSGVMREGAGNIKSWLTPRPALHAGYNLRTGGVVPVHYADGGRAGYAGGGRPTPEDVAAMYAGIFSPGQPPPHLVPGPPPRPTIDATSDVLDGDRLGLGLGNEPPALSYAATPDDIGMNQPSGGGGIMSSGAAPNSLTGVVPFTGGDQFTTTPAPGFSENIGDAWKSLSSGKGLNLSPDMRQALLSAGLGMMASKSPFALQGIGEGGLAGVQAWNERQKLERENAAQRAANALSGSQIALQAQQAGLTGAEAARTRQGVLTDRYDFRPSMAGMVVINKVNPNDSQVIPYAQLHGWAADQGGDISQLPNGGQPPVQMTGPEGTRFKIQLPAEAQPSSLGFTEPGQQIVAGQTAQALTDSQKANSAASDATLQLSALRNAAKNLPNTGFLAPGAWAEQRGALVKNFNTLRSIVGMEPINPDQVASIEEMNKLTTQFGFQLARTTGSDVASQVISQGIGAVPSIENTPQGFRSITALIQGGLNRTRDWNDYLNAWVKKTGGDTTGANTAFNRDYPPSLYSQAAILDSAIVPTKQADIDNAPAGTLFNVNGRLMVK